MSEELKRQVRRGESEGSGGGGNASGGHWVRRVLKKPQEVEGEAGMRGGEDEQCGVAGKEVSKPAEIG